MPASHCVAVWWLYGPYVTPVSSSHLIFIIITYLTASTVNGNLFRFPSIQFKVHQNRLQLTYSLAKKSRHMHFISSSLYASAYRNRAITYVYPASSMDGHLIEFHRFWFFTIKTLDLTNQVEVFNQNSGKCFYIRLTHINHCMWVTIETRGR